MLRAAKILSFNPAKGTMKRSSKRHRHAYFSHYLPKERPDICLLGDDVDSNLQEGSEDCRSVQISSSGETVKLYDVNRARRYDGNNVRSIDQPSGQFSFSGGDCDGLSCKTVDINRYHPKEADQPSGQFSSRGSDCLSCNTVDINKYHPTETEDKTVDSGILAQGREIAALFDLGDLSPFGVFKTLAQILALMSKTPLLFGGEPSSILSDVKSIFKRWKEEEDSRNQEQTPKDLEPREHRTSTTVRQNIAIIVSAHIDTCRKANSTSRSKQLKTIRHEPDGIALEIIMVRSSPSLTPSEKEKERFFAVYQYCQQLKHQEHEERKFKRYMYLLSLTEGNNAMTISCIREQLASFSDMHCSIFPESTITTSSRDKRSCPMDPFVKFKNFERQAYRYLLDVHSRPYDRLCDRSRSSLEMERCGITPTDICRIEITTGYGYDRPSSYEWNSSNCIGAFGATGFIGSVSTCLPTSLSCR